MDILKEGRGSTEDAYGWGPDFSATPLLWKPPAYLVFIFVVSPWFVSQVSSASPGQHQTRAWSDALRLTWWTTTDCKMRSCNVCPLRLPVERRCHVGPLHGELPFKFRLILTFTRRIKNISPALSTWQVRACYAVVYTQLTDWWRIVTVTYWYTCWM